MVAMNVFTQDAFSLMSLVAAVEKVDFVPSRLGSLGLFTPRPVTTTTVMVEERSGSLALVPTSPRGAPLPQRTTERRTARSFTIPRLAKGDVMRADEIQGIRAFGSESETMMAMTEVARRMWGPASLMTDLEATWEYHRLGAVQGVLADSDGSTIYNWFTEFGITQDDEIDFDLDAASPAAGVVREKCTQVVRQTMRALKTGSALTTVRIKGICGDAFWDDLIAHSEVSETFKYQEGQQLRQGVAFSTLNYGGIEFENYRGTDDGSTVAVGTDKCKFFPVGVPGLFEVAFAPGESFDVVNTPGRPVYPRVIPDPTGRDEFVELDMRSYPLHMCTRPKVLQRAKRT